MTITRFKPEPARQWDKKTHGDPLFTVLIDTLFDQENRIRVLEGKAPVSRQQALQAFKQRLKERPGRKVQQ